MIRDLEGSVFNVWLQAAGFGDGEAFTSETFTGKRVLELEEMEVFAVSGYP